MMMNAVIHSFGYGLDYLREHVADLSAEQMVRQPVGSGGMKMLNHPLWVIGHLIVVSQNIAGAIGISRWLPDDFEKKYGTGSMPVADASVYDAKERLLEMLAEARGRVVRAVENLSEEQLAAEFPDAAYREVFPSIRHALVQVLVGHTAYHVGQVGVWRRAMGLPAMKRGIE